MVTVIHYRSLHQVVHIPHPFRGGKGRGEEQRRTQLGSQTPAQRPTLSEGLDLRQMDLHPISLSFLTIRSGR